MSFTDLATEYRKFAVATKGTTWPGGNAEKSSTAWKLPGARTESPVGAPRRLHGADSRSRRKLGAVQMEELRQQPRRLPAGRDPDHGRCPWGEHGTLELIKMMEQGRSQPTP